MYTLWILLLLALFSIGSCRAKHHPRLHSKSMERVQCFSQQQLEESPDKVVESFVGPKMNWDSSDSLVQSVEEGEKRRKRRKRSSDNRCNLETISRGQGLSDRSISPWTYSINVDENRYPRKLAFAQCLCKHCINSYTGKETSSLNSATIHQNILVLKKEACPGDSSKFTFRLHYEKVPVACTCVLPKY